MAPDDGRPQPALNPAKFCDPRVTADGQTRAMVALSGLRTLWFNTGTLCNLTCRNCYIESSPTNDRLVYLSRAEVAAYLNEIARDGLGTAEIGFTGGEPFMNPDIVGMIEDCLARGLRVLVLTNAMKPMIKLKPELARLRARGGDQLTIRVSLDHYTPAVHERERGPRTWQPTIDGLDWLAREGFRIAVAGRSLTGETQAAARDGYAGLIAARGWPIDAHNPAQLVLFPEMDAGRDVPEITTACWGILNKSPDSVMCASSRMVVKHNGAAAPTVAACTLLPYDPQFDLGPTLRDAARPVALNHPHCARFCVLGGAACS
ncbi:MAG: radical SAM protein [Rhodospirillaceae bacterium]|nr:radical SAM protein [Rhodospirillaceae bacterium]